MSTTKPIMGAQSGAPGSTAPVGTASGTSSLNATPPGMPTTSTGTSLSSTDIIVILAIIGIVVFLWWRNRDK